MNNRSFFLFVIIFLFSSIYAAGIEEKIKECSDFTHYIQKLDCFNKIAKQIKEKKEDLDTNKTNKWETTVSHTLNNEYKNVKLTLQASKSQSNWNKPINLHIECKNNKTKLYISWSTHLNKNCKTKTTIDNQKMKNEKWLFFKNKKTTYFPGNNIRFIKKLFTASELKIETMSYANSKLSAIFELSDLENTISPLREACHW